MPTITFRRASNVQSIPITDGQIIFDTSRNIILMDNGNVRNQYAGATQLISTTPEATDTNAFNAQASTQLFLQKTTVIDTKANALAVNQNYVPLGCLAFKEALGTSNYSNVGNGTISGALVNLNSGLTGVNNQLSINNTQFYFDYKNGQYGYNTSAARGADTFHPFNSFTGSLVYNLMDTGDDGTRVFTYTAPTSGYYMAIVTANVGDIQSYNGGARRINYINGFSTAPVNLTINPFDAILRVVIGYVNAGTAISASVTVVGNRRSRGMSVFKFNS
jgi:hypothetical protein